MDAVDYTFLREVHGYIITAISMCDSLVTVTLESVAHRASLICTHAVIFCMSLDSISILRLSSEDRRVAQVHTLNIHQETLLFLVLTGGAYLTIRAKAIALQ